MLFPLNLIEIFELRIEKYPGTAAVPSLEGCHEVAGYAKRWLQGVGGVGRVEREYIPPPSAYPSEED